MDTIGTLLARSKTIGDFAKHYAAYLKERMDALDTAALERFVSHLKQASVKNATIFCIGNGGSAATATHMANDLSALGPAGKIPLRALSLAENTAVLLATANDRGYDRIFVDQLRVHYRPGDMLIAISASGNSPNVLSAAEWVTSQKGTVIAFVGFDGGKLKKIADTTIQVSTPSGEYGPVEDIHLVIDHLVSTWLAADK